MVASSVGMTHGWGTTHVSVVERRSWKRQLSGQMATVYIAERVKFLSRSGYAWVAPG